MDQQINSNKKLKHFLRTEFRKIRDAGQINTGTSEYFGQIGSIPIEDIPYEIQIKVKLDAIKNIFSFLDKETFPHANSIEITPSPKIDEYRFRMDFVCTNNPIHEPHDRFGQRKAGNFSWVVDMHSCSLIPERWFDRTRSVYEKLLDLGIKNYDLKTAEGNLRYLVIRQHGDEGMLNIVTKVGTKNFWSLPDAASQHALDLGFKSIHWIHQPSLGDFVEGEIVKTWGTNNIEIKLGENKFKVGPDSFFQNNISGFEKILNYTKSHIASFIGSGSAEDTILYDLYSGVGTFGISLSQYFEKIYAFEINKEAAELAKRNAELNQIDNIISSQQDLSDPSFEPPMVEGKKVLIVDPPRTGLEKNGIEHVKKLNADLVIYVSCNPVTQANDLKELKEIYEVKAMKAFDLFPHTYHMENVVVLSKRVS